MIIYINFDNKYVIIHLILIAPNTKISLELRSAFYRYHPNLKFTNTRNERVKREQEDSSKKGNGSRVVLLVSILREQKHY